jgi:hypothetical protein
MLLLTRLKSAQLQQRTLSGKFDMENKGIKPSVALATHREEIRQVVAAHHARNVRVFGSVLQGTDTEQSDLDLLVDPTPEMTMLDIGAIRHKLLKLLKVQVDVLTPNALPEKFRSAVLAEAKLI